MKTGEFKNLDLAGFTGCVRSDFFEVLDAERLSNFHAELEGVDAKVLAEGRHRVVALPMELEGGVVTVAVKAFGKQSAWKNRYDFKNGSKASRSFLVAEHLTKQGVGTPEPLAYFERWEGPQLMESYYLSSYLDSLTSFRDELLRIYEEQPECDHLVSLLTHVAGAMRKMHDSGFCHRDLGNQNMEFRRDGNGWGEVQFIDLNRGRIREELSEVERATDFSRINLPGEFLNIFTRIYWGGPPPKRFTKHMKKLRSRFALWQKSEALRHPSRSRDTLGLGAYPTLKNIWIWDSQSAQASIVMDRKERRASYGKGRHSGVLSSLLRSGKEVWDKYRDLLPTAFQKRVELKGRIGMALESTDLEFDQQFEILSRLGTIPVLIRFYHHEEKSQWKKGIEQVRALIAAGHEVMIAMVQDRRAITESESWKGFLEFVLEEIGSQVLHVEICHAVNRIKWGIHGPQEQRALLEPLVALQKRFPNISFTGPACIDFEYHYVLSSLDETPDGLHYQALSHHLYVDRRGAPENKQGRYSTVEKCALLMAIARNTPQCDDQVIISEVNWPLADTGIWSPVSATYLDPNQDGSPLEVSEKEYGIYMIRYFLLAICSGFVEQVYWWRLVSHGFGLVDERDEGGWRERPAFQMLQFFLKTLGEATFVEKLGSEDEVYFFRFTKDEEEWVVAWTNGVKRTGSLPFVCVEMLDAEGKPLELGAGEFVLGDSPVYCRL